MPRDPFKQDLRHSLGAFMTICEVKRNAALDRVRAVLETGADPGSLLGKQGMTPAQTPDETVDAEDYAVDIEDIANQQIVSLIKSEFAGHALVDLVAEILRVEGYTTNVSPPGPDQGVDILAAGGTLGLGEDRICVQVKSGTGAANHDVVLRLIGSVSNTQAQTGLLVSIGGVNAAAQKELDNNSSSCACGKCPTCSKRSFGPTKTFPTAPREAALETNMGADIGGRRMTAYTMQTAHHEIALEQHLVDRLVAAQGYTGDGFGAWSRDGVIAHSPVG